MFVLSPSVETTTASASSTPGPAQDRRVHAVADDEAAVPALAEPAERLLLLVDGDDVPAFLAEPVRDGRADPAAPDHDRLHRLSLAEGSSCAPTRQGAATRAVLSYGQRRLLLEDPLRVGEHHHLAGRAAEHVVDGRAEEAGLAAPARRRAHHDQVGADLACLLDDRLADRARADGVALDRRPRAPRPASVASSSDVDSPAPPGRPSRRRAAATAGRGSRAGRGSSRRAPRRA